MDKNKNLIIGGLLAIVLVMAVGYAAFSTQLKISNTATIGSGNSSKTYWDVHIKSITPGTKEAGTLVGTAVNNSASVAANGLSATFNASLASPGDSITYTVTVENSGQLNAKLSELTFTPSDNAAIVYDKSGIAVNNVINAGSTTTFTVTVSYDSNVTSQPSNKNSTLTMTLNYVQATA